MLPSSLPGSPRGCLTGLSTLRKDSSVMADDRQPQDPATAEGRKAVQRSLDRRGQGGS